MLNRSNPTNDPRPWGIVSPRRAQTTSCTIHDGNFITDNRQQTTVHNDNSRTIHDSSSSAVFNGPVQGYIHTAKNRGAVNGYVQITNISHKAGDSGEASPRYENRSPITTVSSQIDKADRTISQKQESKKVGGVGQLGSSAPLGPDHKLEQELLGLSSNMQAFVKSLQLRDAREKGTAEPAKRRNHTI